MDELMDRRVPYSAEAEQSILGSMLIDPACVPDVVNAVRASEFYIDTNREIFETIFSMFAQGMTIDPVTVLGEMEARGLKRDTTSRYLRELMDVTPTAANVLKYCGIVRERALLRNLGGAADSISELVYGGVATAQQALELAEKSIYDLRKSSASAGLVKISDVLLDVMQNISDAALKEGDLPGVTTGLRDLDNYLMGLQPGNLIIIASRPGMGKTSIALNMAVSAAKASGKTVAIFSLEMSRAELVMRLLASESHIDSEKLVRGRLSPSEWTMLVDAAAVLSRLDIRIDQNSSITVTDIAAECRRVDNLGLIIVDYLQLMQSAGSGNSWANESRTQAVSDMSRMMKITAKELGVPLVCLSQLNREVEKRKDNHKPMISDLRESGSIEQDADAVIALYREGFYNPECADPGLSEAIVLKNRHGRVGSVRLRWFPERMTYVNDDGGLHDEN